MTSETSGTRTVVQYAVRTPNSNAVLTVTSDRAVAERELRRIEGGQIVTRIITTSTWQLDIEQHLVSNVVDERAQLHDQLAKRAVIDQAIGIMRSRSGASHDEALSRLVQVSRADDIDLADAALRLVENSVRRGRMLRP